MKYNIPDRVLSDIALFAHKHNIENVILFGSRAKGTHTKEATLTLPSAVVIAMAFIGI